NITHMETNDGIYDYEYDYMGRLTKEYNPVLNQTIVITYNKQNISTKTYYQGKTTQIVKEMEYLTNSVNQLVYLGIVENGNETPLSITYGTNYLGNPSAIGAKTLSWEGRRLKAITSDDIEYTYNEQGIRTMKDVDGVITTYHLKGSNVIAETKNSNTTFFIYNEQDQLIGFEYGNKQYFYVRDLQGNIKEVIDNAGTIMVSYKYDAWGNWINKASASNGTSLGDTLVAVNPFIYKGYYYDAETDWYYLKSRYYSPLLSRFINMDDTDNLEPGNVDGVNLFAYCGNNPVMHEDESGSKWWKKALMILGSVAMITVGAVLIATGAGAIVGAALIGAGVGSIAGGMISESNGGSFAAGWVVGGLVGAAAGAGIAYALPAITSFASSTLSISIGQGLSFGGGTLALTSGLTISISGAQVIAGGLALTSALGAYMFARTSRSNGYWGESWPGDHDPQHFHLKGEDGSNVRIGTDGNPLKGEPFLNPQQRKALIKLWKEIVKKLFKL
ncbi:MAG: hypothetical protein KJ847_01040, partial [Firmicutes bacterium]|nr:hypothetical protein [Bacillota bacterium]